MIRYMLICSSVLRQETRRNKALLSFSVWFERKSQSGSCHNLPARPMIRVDGLLHETEHPILDAETCRQLVYSILSTEQVA